ncbi:MAG: DASS family sodium-coupled anion symporter [Saprospiraceae bacterium]|nr:DASS family sodium-coupled anion symporter [Saprospiraceae bacterium]
MPTLKQWGLFWGPLIFIALLLWPPPQGLSPEAWKVIAMAVLMLSWWITGAVPIAVTALLPMVCLPLLKVSTLKEATTPYANPVVYLFMGGFMLAVAMEKWNLHRRIALNIVQRTGVNANGIILGFMLATGFVSMWISNTATAVMMLPIAVSVIGLLTRELSGYSEKGLRNFSVSMMLGIAYSASIGGMATLIGTPPNVVFKGYMLSAFDYEVSFSNWMIVSFPFSLFLLFCTYWLITRLLYPNRLGHFDHAIELIAEETHKLGKMSAGERVTLWVFISAAGLWIFQTLINKWIPGLGLSDEIIALLAAIALFILPSEGWKGKPVLEWGDTEKLPWGILLLFGGGLSLAGALENTGVVKLIGQQFEGIQNADFLIVLGLSIVAVYLTEIMSNVALVTVMLPVVGAVAVGAGINPILMCMPVTLAASCAFMLPMSTPPNAIVFASGHLTISQMARAGFWLNIIAIILISLLCYIAVPLVFDHPVQ